MKVSLNWVKEYAKVDLKLDQLLEKIGRQLGAVEEVIEIGKKYQDVVIARVVSSAKHPDADKLSVCRIDDGRAVKGVKRDAKGHVEIVCGAPNVRAGMLAAWLPPGSTVPSTINKDPLVLEAREIRGVVSNGMLASGHELAISEDHSGIVELEEGKPGDKFAEVLKLNDVIIDIENKMFTHRPDCFGILGVAREIAGIQKHEFRSPSWYLGEAKFSSASGLNLSVKVADKKLVPRFMAVAVKDVEIKPSPLWLQTYLMRVGIKPISNIVDLTNYYMYLTGQPTHAYDADKLPAMSLETRQSKKGEKLKLLGGKEVTFEDNQTILITSKNVPVGIGGVMGGADTEVDNNTKNIVLECANFDMYSIRRTSMQYGIFTEAVTRFNKGQSPHQNDRVLKYLLNDVIKLSGGQQASRVIDVHGKLTEAPAIKIDAGFINARLGVKLSLKEIAKLLENVEFKVTTVPADKNHLYIKPPFWRTDIEIKEDVVEEVGRLYGYDHLPLDLPKRTIKPTERNKMYDFKAKVRGILSRAGANEVLTYSFVHGDLIEKAGQDPKQAFQLSNAISPDLQYYRLSLTPSLLDKVHPNTKAGYDQFAIFEMGKAHVKGQNDANEASVPREFHNLALVITSDGKQSKSGAAYFEARLYLDNLATGCGVKLRYEAIKDEPPYPAGNPFDPARSARVYIDDQDKPIGMVGELKPAVRRNFKLPVLTAAFEVDLDKLVAVAGSTGYMTIPRFPKVEQDLTLKVPEELSFGEIEGFISEVVRELVEEKTLWIGLEPLGIYQKDAGSKNVTFRFKVASYERTLTDGEVNTLLDEMAAKAHQQFGAERV